MNHLKQAQLKKITGAALGALALMSATPAMAAVIDFESIGPSIYGGTETLSEHGYTMTVIDTPAAGPDGTGFAGAVGDGNDPFLCAIAACPTGNASHFYMGVNDGGLKVTRGDNAAFQVSGIDYAFLAPVGGLPSYSWGQLTLLGTRIDGGTIAVAYDFPLLDAAGNSPFVSNALTAFGNVSLSSLVISSCLFDGAGGCYSPLPGSENQAQFAFDNLDISAVGPVAPVPEPETYAMMGLGLGLVGLLSRRRAKAAANAAATTAAATINA
ncbi:PEP-CTERM protein-sorting domain-containing protein [Duganella sp. CF517]|uniref:NF038120 family PEP-CTERM protein n=1 Tax=Duganella sp. CF517 TaxID=1881038 RepID=UPI0008B10F69|nr:NF038120 family PEP-CTERM protein [Duganella sp. CF517]SEO54355.1 PEP-CTERM protein-sorting domain-containing protein [Duganella sp. CF517]